MRGVRVVAHLQGEEAVLVEDGVGLRLRRPLGVEGKVGPHGGVEVIGLGERGVRVPACEHLAGLGGAGGLGGLGAGGDGLRLNGRAPVGVEGHGVGGPLLPLGVEGEVGLHGRVEVVGLGEGLVGVPALESVAGLGGVGGLGGLGAAPHRLRLHSRASVGVEGDRVARLGGRGGAGEHDEDLGRHRAGGGAEGDHRVGPVVVVHAGEHARGGRPGEGIGGPGVRRAPVGGGPERARVGVGDVHAGVLGVAVHHGGQLLAGDRPVGPEAALVGAGGVAGDDAGLNAPGHGGVVPGAALHVGEGGAARGGAARHAPQHRGDLGAGEGLVGAEVARGPARGRVGEARHEALVGGLVDPRGVPLPGGHVLEGGSLGGGGRHRNQTDEQRKRGDEGPDPAEDTSPDLRGPIPARHSPAPFLAPSADGPSEKIQTKQ